MTSGPFLTRVVLKNYKSIAACNLELAPLTMLVGPNGSGKSNFLDALRLVSDALRTTLDHALRDRGGINEVRRRSSGHPTHFGIRLDFVLRDGTKGHYAFRVGAKPRGAFEVQTEECALSGGPPARFHVDRGTRTDSWAKVVSGLPSDRLHLVAASGEPDFRPVYDALAHMAFYSLNPDRMRELQTPDAGEILLRDGGNAASVLRVLTDLAPERKERIEKYLAQVVPGVVGVEAIDLGPKETMRFRQNVAGSENPWHFLAANMSDGTLRAFGVLLGLFQIGARRPATLVGIEEPEIALHPAAAGVLLDALREVCQDTQVIVTSHSPDLLDLVEPGRETILAVHAENGNTEIAPVDAASVRVLEQGLYTPGELLRLNQLTPDADLFVESSRQLALFDEGTP